MTFSEEIKQVRKRLFLTQAEMASLMDVTEHTIQRWEHGFPPRDSARRKLQAICEQHKIKLEEGEKP